VSGDFGVVGNDSRSGSNSDAHSELVHDILLALGALPDARIWRNSVGAARPLHNPARVLRFGLKGSADISGIVLPFGRRLEIEAKTGSGQPSKEQRSFLAMINRMGGVAGVARSVADAVRLLERAKVPPGAEEARCAR
jgi:hypothetical protein